MPADRSPKIPSSVEKMKHFRQESGCTSISEILLVFEPMISCIRILDSIRARQSAGKVYFILHRCHHVFRQIIARTQHLNSTPSRFLPDADLYLYMHRWYLVYTNKHIAMTGRVIQIHTRLTKNTTLRNQQAAVFNDLFEIQTRCKFLTSIHSSIMRTARLECASRGLCLPPGGLPPGGVCFNSVCL